MMRTKWWLQNTERRIKVSGKKSYQYGQQVTYHNNENQLTRFCHLNSLSLDYWSPLLNILKSLSLALYSILFCSVPFPLTILIMYSYHSLTSGSSRSSRFSQSVAMMLSYLYGMNRKYSHTIRRYFSNRTNIGLNILWNSWMKYQYCYDPSELLSHKIICVVISKSCDLNKVS